MERGRGKPEVEEPPHRLDLGELGVILEGGGQLLGYGLGWAADLLGQEEGDPGGQVSEIRPGPFQR